MGSRVPWSDLPQELIGEIAKFLETPTNIQKFREVCHSWLSSCPRSSKLLSLLFPHKIPAPIDDSFFKPNSCLVLVASNIYVLHPRQGGGPQNLSVPWMVRVEELNPGSLQVQCPLAHNSTIELPEDFPMGLNLSGTSKVTEVFKGYNLRKECTDSPQNESLGLGIKKVVLHSDSHGKSPASVGYFTIVVLFFVGRLYVVRLSDNHWSSIRCRRISRFDDVLNLGGKIFVIDRKGRLYRLCCKTLSCVCIVPDPPSNPLLTKTRKHLVELRGELHMLCFCKTFFRVFKLKEGQRQWTEVYYLGEDVLLFLRPDCCFSALAKDFPNWIGNSIVYHLNSFRTYGRDNHYLYNMHENPDQSFYFAVYRMGGSIFFMEKYSDVLWPPPSWLRYLAHHSPPMASTALEMLAEKALDTNVSIDDDQDSRAPT